MHYNVNDIATIAKARPTEMEEEELAVVGLESLPITGS
jgi:hypothetical protein